jgi:hypothetical protein
VNALLLITYHHVGLFAKSDNTRHQVQTASSEDAWGGGQYEKWSATMQGMMAQLRTEN